jgi:hypothetical protein
MEGKTIFDIGVNFCNQFERCGQGFVNPFPDSAAVYLRSAGDTTQGQRLRKGWTVTRPGQTALCCEDEFGARVQVSDFFNEVEVVFLFGNRARSFAYSLWTNQVIEVPQ